jgi:ankyrin repeat protein
MNGRAESQPAPSIEFWGDLLRDRSEADVIAFVRRQPELVNVPDAVSSEYALEQAVFHEKCELVQVLLDLGADPDQLNDQGNLALHSAIQLFERSPEVALQLVEVLLARGADLEARGFPDFTALHRACAVNAIPIAMTLIDRGASLTAAAEAWVDGGRTPLDVALTHRHRELAALLRNRGATSVDDLPTA